MEQTTIVSGIKCNNCGKQVPNHTIQQHLDPTNPIHTCPHKDYTYEMNFKIDKFFDCPNYFRTMLSLVDRQHESKRFRLNVIMCDGTIFGRKQALSPQELRTILLEIKQSLDE